MKNRRSSNQKRERRNFTLNKNRTVIFFHAENMAETSLQFVSVNAPLLFIEEQENQTLQGKQNDTSLYL